MPTIQVNKSALSETRSVEDALLPLADGAVRLKVESFAVTANNVTYAVIGDMFGYWNFFPAPEGWGVVPMWGHAVVEASNCAGIEPGERVYGYLPMGSHLDVVPQDISVGQFRDATAHRQPMAIFYNLYSRLAADPEHDPAHEAERMIFGPLFKTGFLIAAMFVREGWFGAEQAVLTSASSKTALALASSMRDAAPGVARIGLTSARNIAFVKGSGLYDQVFSYDDVAALPQRPSVSVDFAGNAAVLRAVHEGLGHHLTYSCTVGATHVDARGGAGEPLPGPTPTLFFAPTEAADAIKALGPKGFAEAVGKAWVNFLYAVKGTIRTDERDGLDAAAAAYRDTLAGVADPAVGIVVRV
ncbi:MAG: DUF2855 family protein [Sphingomonadales bacterium]|nr:DUF2855 family protein [Sphingomonadales bacterium]